MVFQNIRERIYVGREIKISLEKIEIKINSFVGSEPIAICPTPTENSWQGVASATSALFPERTFHLPQYYSNTVYTTKELDDIADFLIKNESNHIVFSGYLAYFDQLIHRISKSGKRVSIIYHGSHASVLEDPSSAVHFQSLIELSKNKIVSNVGLVKKDLDKTLEKLTGQKFHPILLKTDESIMLSKPKPLEGLNIGVLMHDSFRKNLYNMVSAGLLNTNANVHLKGKYKTNYLGNSDRLKVHGNLDAHKDFLDLIGSMTINYYVTYSECWGQFVNESLAMGVPCLTSNVSSVLDFDPELKKLLTVHEFDNDYAIYKKSEEVLENLAFIAERGPQYIRELNINANDYLSHFLD